MKVVGCDGSASIHHPRRLYPPHLEAAIGLHGEMDRGHMSPRFCDEGGPSHAGGRELGWRQHVEVASHATPHLLTDAGILVHPCPCGSAQDIACHYSSPEATCPEGYSQGA